MRDADVNKIKIKTNMAEKLREMVLLSKQTTIQVSSAYVGYFLLVAGGYTGTLFISSLVRGCHNPI